MMLAPLLHVLQARARHVEVAEHVGAEGALELLGVELGRIVDLVLLGGVVHQDVDAAELLDGALDRLPAEHLVADVAGEQERLASLCLDQARGLLRVVVFFQIEDRDQRALARHRDRDRAADAAVAAGDDRDLVLELADAGIFRQVFRPRPHLAFDARLMVLRLRRLPAASSPFRPFFRACAGCSCPALRCRDGNVSGQAGFPSSAFAQHQHHCGEAGGRGSATADRARAALRGAPAASAGCARRGSGSSQAQRALRSRRRGRTAPRPRAPGDTRPPRASRRCCAQPTRRATGPHAASQVRADAQLRSSPAAESDAPTAARHAARTRARGSETARRTVRRA